LEQDRTRLGGLLHREHSKEAESMRVFVTCSGLGHVNRGYESFAREVFDTFRSDPDFDMYLFKGGGQSSKREKVVFNWHRRGTIARFLSKCAGIDAYLIEELSFVFFLLPYLFWHKPSLILLSDHRTCAFLWNIRHLFGLKYKLLFSNGAPNGPPFSRCDHVQQLLPYFYKQAIEAGESTSHHTILPYGIHVQNPFSWPTEVEKAKIREQLELPLDKKVVISVGAINSHHKRMDYLVKEFEQLPDGQYFLLVLGSKDEESEKIFQLAESTLIKGSYAFKSVPYQEVSSYYLASDLFVLCSLSEGFGRVYLEALMLGLPVFSHNYPVAHEVMQDKAQYVDMKQKGALAKAIQQTSRSVSREAQREFVFQQYDWSVLKQRYKDMILSLS
jgi:1,2-diacylglycerol 3-alpha-glucosyltransferase